VAQERVVVVELFTSQGCSSCPPADKLLGQIAEKDNVIALSLHVDYWDYIGWKDEFADPAFTKRQKGYARAAQRRSIYTPQMVINGADALVGAKPMRLSDLVQKNATRLPQVELQAVRTGDTVEINARPLSVDGSMVVHLVRYDPKKEIRISRGENAGRNMSYTNVVESWSVVGDWDGKDVLALSSPIEGDLPIVVIVQKADHGAIMAAVRLR